MKLKADESQTKRYAVSTLEIKAVDDEKRILTGIASTPSVDRQGDIVEPMGCEYTLPIPFLWQHYSDEPIGWVTAVKISKAGIAATIQIAKIDAEGTLKQRVDDAWESIKAGLVRGLSIGFKGQEYAWIDDSYGRRFIKWLWLELSAVTIAANGEASIETIKSIDREVRVALLGNDRAPSVSVPLVQRSAERVPPTNQGNAMKTFAEQIKDLEATRAAKVAQMTAVMTKATESGATTDAAGGEEFDTLSGEIKSIDADLGRLRTLEDLNKGAAAEVKGGSTTEAQNSRLPAVARVVEKLAPGVAFARYAMCVAKAKGNMAAASSLAKQWYPKDEKLNEVLKFGVEHDTSNLSELIQRAAVAAGTTTDSTWAAPLVAYNQFAGDFVEFLRPKTLIGQFGTKNIPSLRRIPFNVHIRGQSGKGTGYWVREGYAKPVTKADFNDAYHGYYKVANIAVLTQELMRFSDPSAEILVRDELAAALIERMDTDFIDPAKAAVANVSPASILNGVTPIVSTATTDADAIRAEITSLWTSPVAADYPASSGVYITDVMTALKLSSKRNALGQREFPDISILGGSIDGVPVLVSNYVPHPTSGSNFALVFASEIWFSDDGQVQIDASREASILMDSAPNMNSPTPTAAAMVSMFQTNSVALKAEAFVNWSKRRTLAAVYLSDVDWA